MFNAGASDHDSAQYSVNFVFSRDFTRSCVITDLYRVRIIYVLLRSYRCTVLYADALGHVLRMGVKFQRDIVQSYPGVRVRPK